MPCPPPGSPDVTKSPRLCGFPDVLDPGFREQGTAMTAPNPVMPTYAPQPVAFERGQGAWLFDTEGRRYLDCLSGIAVNTLGHNHPRLVAAIADQASKIIHCSNLFEIPLREQMAQRLVDLSGMTNVFFCNSGLEASHRQPEGAEGLRAAGRGLRPRAAERP